MNDDILLKPFTNHNIILFQNLFIFNIFIITV